MTKAEEWLSQNSHRCNTDENNEIRTGEYSQNEDETMPEKSREVEREATEQLRVKQLLEEREALNGFVQNINNILQVSPMVLTLIIQILLMARRTVKGVQMVMMMSMMRCGGCEISTWKNTMRRTHYD